VIAAPFEQAGGKNVTDGLIIVGNESEYASPMSDGRIMQTAVPEGLG
jgi:hypothetical protein